MTTYRYLQPLDVLFLRGNKLFGDPGSFGESLVPPWPSAASGALRSQILARDRVDLAEFASGRFDHPELGTPARPGPFRITDFHLAKREPKGSVEALYAPPADLILSRDAEGGITVNRLEPQALAPGLAASFPLPMVPVLPEGARRKPITGYWLCQTGWQCYLNGGTPDAGHLTESGRLWQMDARVGVGLDPEMHRADDGKLFGAQAVAFTPDTGFLVGVDGAETPVAGILRLGGDGRGAAVDAVSFDPATPDLDRISAAGRCRIVLTTPGIFPDGWRLPGVDAEGRIDLPGVRAKLVCAAVPRAEIVSGWDLASGQPKAAQRAAPAGSVYWLDGLEATAEALRKLADTGLWQNPGENSQRRTEGFNRAVIAAWNLR